MARPQGGERERERLAALALRRGLGAGRCWVPGGFRRLPARGGGAGAGLAGGAGVEPSAGGGTGRRPGGLARVVAPHGECPPPTSRGAWSAQTLRPQHPLGGGDKSEGGKATNPSGFLGDSKRVGRALLCKAAGTQGCPWVSPPPRPPGTKPAARCGAALNFTLRL